MFCQNCGTKLNDGARFCSNCGASIGNVPVPAAAPVVEAPVAPAPVAAPVVEAPVAPAPVAAPAVEAPVAPAPVTAPVVEAPVAPAPVTAPAVEAPVAPAPVATAPAQPVNYAYPPVAPAPQPPKKKGLSPVAILLIILSIIVVGVGAFVAVDYLANDGEIMESIFGADDKDKDDDDDDKDENEGNGDGEGENDGGNTNTPPVIGDYKEGYLQGYDSATFVAAFEKAWKNYGDYWYDSYGERIQISLAWKDGWNGPSAPSAGAGNNEIAFTCVRSEIHSNGTSNVYTYLVYNPSTKIITANSSVAVVKINGEDKTYNNTGSEALDALKSYLVDYLNYQPQGNTVPPQTSPDVPSYDPSDEPTTEQPSQNENVSVSNGYLQNYPSRPFVAAFDEAISNYLAQNQSNTAELTWSLGWDGASAPDDSYLYGSKVAFTCLMEETVYGENADSYIYLIYDADQNLITVESYVQVQYINGQEKTIELDSAQGLSTLNSILNTYL